MPRPSWPELAPSGTPEALYAKLMEITDVGLLVTHQPFVDTLIADLTSTVPHMSPAALALIRGEAILPGYCELTWVKYS